MARAKTSTTTRKPAQKAAAPIKATTSYMPEMPALPKSNYGQSYSLNSESPYSLISVINWANNNFAIILLVLIFFVTGFTAGSLWTRADMAKTTAPVAGQPTADQPTVPEGPTEAQLKAMPEVTAEDHIQGSRDAKIVLVEYSDFECPFCARFHPTMISIMKEYGKDVAWVYRHYPLPFHPNAQKAAEASECVAELGGNEAFWKYSDAIVAKTNEMGGKLSPEAITEVSLSLGVNKAAFESCMTSNKYAKKVADMMAGGSKAGVTGTPGTILVTKDGKYDFISGAQPEAQVKAIIEKYL